MRLSNVKISNFRSIKGEIDVPLDARIVLVHGENGAGKTSLLSAIELALTGRVQFLERADPTYQSQLLHWQTQAGFVKLDGDDGTSFGTSLSMQGMTVEHSLSGGEASYFSERCYLPQSLLGQLLNIYQSAGGGLGSPLAKFVGELLGLDRLNAIDAGLKPLQDIRNLAEGYTEAESEKARLDRVIGDHRSKLDVIANALAEALKEISASRIALGLTPSDDESSLDQSQADLSASLDEGELTRLADLRRQLEAIRREAVRNRDLAVPGDEASLAASHARALRAFDDWKRKHEARVAAGRKRVETLLPAADLPAAFQAFADTAIKLLRAEQQQAAARSGLASKSSERKLAADAEFEVAREQLATIDGEIGRIAPNARDLGAALAQITAFIVDDVCPVCDRNFSEKEEGDLAGHVHRKVQTLSTSAQRLLDLSRTRGQQQGRVEALQRELTTLSSSLLDDKDVANLSRATAALDSILAEIEALAKILAEGESLTRTETTARRALCRSSGSRSRPELGDRHAARLRGLGRPSRACRQRNRG